MCWMGTWNIIDMEVKDSSKESVMCLHHVGPKDLRNDIIFSWMWCPTPIIPALCKSITSSLRPVWSA